MDGSDVGERALAWAALRATAGHASLHIVHVVKPRVYVDGWGFPLMVPRRKDPAEQRILDQAVGFVRARTRETKITATLRSTDIVAALLAEGRTAELIVVGSRHDRRRRWAFWSITNRVARRARGRVVIVSPDNEILV